MSSEVLAVGTSTTGQSVFLDASYSILIPNFRLRRSRAVELENSLYRGAPLLDVSIEATQEALRKAYTLSDSDRVRLCKTGRRVAELFNAQAMASALLDVIL